MAWRPNDLITEGAIAVSDDGSVKGVLHFNGLDRPVKLDLTGCPEALRGRLVFQSTQAREAHHVSETDVRPADEYMHGFALLQRGEADGFRIEGSMITLAWNSEANQRVCIEFDATFTLEPMSAAGAP